MELNFLGRKKFMWKLNSDLKEPFGSHCKLVIRQESYLEKEGIESCNDYDEYLIYGECMLCMWLCIFSFLKHLNEHLSQENGLIPCFFNMWLFKHVTCAVL